ncbi:MAG: right-handed parallel beta-helix repeat-containing protein [Planctomycetota bacterium]|nr:right-handed parallel beta-helix repeat-containing protein [Planctomycetota bacterium]
MPEARGGLAALAAAVLLAWAGAPARCAEWFVAPDGQGDGAAREKPAGNIAATLGKAAPGDTVTLLPGTYKGRLDLVNVKGQPGKPITLRSAEKHKAVIDLSGNEKNKFKIVSAEHLTLDGLEILGSPAVGLKVDDSKGVKVLNCRIHDHILEGVFFMRCEDMELGHCEIFRNGDLKGKENNIDALMSRFVKRGHYHHNDVYGNSSAGFDVGATQDTVIEKNFIHHNGANFSGPGLKLLHEGPKSEEGYCYGTVVRNNIFLDNQSCGVFFSTGSGETGKLHVVHNTILVRRVAEHGGLRWHKALGGHGGIGMPHVNNVFQNNIVYVLEPRDAPRKDWEHGRVIHWSETMAEVFSKQFVDCNLYFTRRPERFAGEDNKASMDFEAWRKLSGLDAHSIFAEGVFASLEGETPEVARLKAGAPAIDAGMDLGDLVKDDFFGNPRKDGKPDLGAVEFSP